MDFLEVRNLMEDIRITPGATISREGLLELFDLIERQQKELEKLRLFEAARLRLFVIRRDPQRVDWDEYDSIVVKAENEESARKIAVDFHTYFSEPDVTVEEVNLYGKEEIIHTSFKAG